MSSYKEMYFTLVRAQHEAILTLQKAHQKAEEMLLSVDVSDHLRVLRVESLQEGKQLDIYCLNLSGRVYNALKYQFGEHGRDSVPTIDNVLSIESYEQLRKIRNLGKKSCFELISKMQDAGFIDWAERMLKSAKQAPKK